MRFERKHAVPLLRNLYAAHDAGEDRAAGYWVAHTVLIVVNFAIAALLGSLGWRALKASRAVDVERETVGR